MDQFGYFVFRIVCIAFIGLTVWATIYEKSLAKIQEIDHENVSPSRQAIHPMHLTKAAKTNGQRIYSYENATIDLESTEPALKLDKIHTNNIINGCTFELRPISIEHNNGNHLANNNRAAAFYRLNNNNANNINNNHHASNNDDANDNNHSKRIRSHNRNGSTYATRAIDNVDHLSKYYLENKNQIYMYKRYRETVTRRRVCFVSSPVLVLCVICVLSLVDVRQDE